MKVEFIADKVQVNSNLAGGNTKIILHTGEYELSKIKELLMIPNEVVVEVTIKYDTD